MLPLVTLTSYVADSNVVHYKEAVMTDDVNEEEAWLHGVIKDFDYIVCSGKYGPLFYKMLSDQAKLIINNMRECELRNMEVKCPSQLD
jgi:hypothetical protein